MDFRNNVLVQFAVLVLAVTAGHILRKMAGRSLPDSRAGSAGGHTPIVYHSGGPIHCSLQRRRFTVGDCIFTRGLRCLVNGRVSTLANDPDRSTWPGSSTEKRH